jgi:hypothetical protein
MSQPRHLARPSNRRRRFAVALVAVLAATGLTATSAPAGAVSPEDVAAHPLVVQFTDTKSIGKCTFTVKKIDYFQNRVEGRLAVQARPVNLAGYTNNAHVIVACTLFGGVDEFGFPKQQAQIIREVNGPLLLTESIPVTVPYLFAGYRLCGEMITTTKSGSSFGGGGCTN